MRILFYRPSGFCSGVSNAVNKTLELAQQGRKVYTLGSLVHNEEVERSLEEQGVKVASSPEEVQEGDLVIRTHGVGPDTLQELNSKKYVEVHDATCSRVRKVQHLASKLTGEYKQVVLWGRREHPEVKGIVEWTGHKAHVVSTLDELADLIKGIEPGINVALLSQTTREKGEFREAAAIFKENFPEGEIHCTICPFVGSLQQAARRLSEKVDAMLIIGSPTSSNTGKLVEVCREVVPAIRVSHAGEMEPGMWEGINSLGVVAGASTPDWIIKEVLEMMEEERMEEVTGEDLENEVSQQELEEHELKSLETGEQVKGKIAQVEEDYALVDVGYKTEAVLPRAEVFLEEGSTLKEKFSLEEEVEVIVLRLNEEEGKIIVSHRRVERERLWSKLESAMENEETLEGKVKEVVDAGIIIELGTGLDGFMPGSLVDVNYIPDFSTFLGQTVEFKVIEMNRERDKVILSRKKVMEEETEKKKKEILDNLEEGEVVTGTVRRLTDFGAFVDVGGIDGLVHISEVSWGRVEHPRDVLKVGQEVPVKVLEVNPENERISLSVRKAEPDPWESITEQFSQGNIIEGKVTRVVNFGVFVELVPGVEGLVHISQVADYHVKHPSEVVEEGDQVKTKILDIRPEDKRISLSIKEAAPSPASYAEEYQANQEEDSSVVKLGDVFGDLFEKGQQEAEEEEEQGDEEEQEQ